VELDGEKWRDERGEQRRKHRGMEDISSFLKFSYDLFILIPRKKKRKGNKCST
jgi:hypothetical protein